MAVNTDVIGKAYPPVSYAVGREKVREYARAVGERSALYFDVAAARAAGYEDVVAPPMFVVVYAFPAVLPALFDDEIGIDFARLVHSGQQFEWGPVVVAGDEIATTVSLADVSERAGNGFYTFGSQSVNQRGETVCTAVWSNVVRGS